MSGREATIDDFIAPGEFTFCSRCGEICHKGSADFMCTKCLSGPSGLHPSGFWSVEGAERDAGIEEYEATVALERAESAVFLRERKSLAKWRRDSGVPPLFWVEEVKK